MKIVQKAEYSDRLRVPVGGNCGKKIPNCESWINFVAAKLLSQDNCDIQIFFLLCVLSNGTKLPFHSTIGTGEFLLEATLHSSLLAILALTFLQCTSMITNFSNGNSVSQHTSNQRAFVLSEPMHPTSTLHTTRKEETRRKHRLEGKFSSNIRLKWDGKLPEVFSFVSQVLPGYS